MIVNPTLHFYGHCEEALALYQSAFGCKVLALVYDDKDGSIQHSEVQLGNIVVRMSDGLDVKPEAQTVFPLFFALNFESEAQVRRATQALLDAGGQVVEPFERFPYSAWMGSVVDPYGFRWRLMAP